jgi:toxin-antitoxin system PIN domain toxin
MLRALLDINVLIALMDKGHCHHVAAINWVKQNQSIGWASCAITQNGCIRIMSQPSYQGEFTPAMVGNKLKAAAKNSDHVFLPCDINLLDGNHVNLDKIIGHRQLTDSYLLALAHHHQCQFVTFDNRVSLETITASHEAKITKIS